MFAITAPLVRRAVPLAFALSLAAPSALRAQNAALPPAAEVVKRHVAAIGGEKAVRQHRGLRATGTIAIPAAGINGELKVVAAAPNRQSLVMSIPGMGEVVSGFDGTHGWSASAMQGARLLEGQELEELKSEADFYAGQLRSHEGIASRVTAERAEMNGESCYRVNVSWKSGRESWECYSAASGLLIATGGKRETPQGTIDMVTLIGDYREFGGVKYATKARQQLMGMEQVLTFSSVEFADVEAAEFAPPPQIATLIQAKSSGTR